MLYNKPNFLYRYCITEGKMADELPKAPQKRGANELDVFPPLPPSNEKEDMNSFQPENPDKKQRVSNTISVENPSDMPSTPVQILKRTNKGSASTFLSQLNSQSRHSQYPQYPQSPLSPNSPWLGYENRRTQVQSENTVFDVNYLTNIITITVESFHADYQTKIEKNQIIDTEEIKIMWLDNLKNSANLLTTSPKYLEYNNIIQKYEPHTNPFLPGLLTSYEKKLALLPKVKGKGKRKQMFGRNNPALKMIKEIRNSIFPSSGQSYTSSMILPGVNFDEYEQQRNTTNTENEKYLNTLKSLENINPYEQFVITSEDITYKLTGNFEKRFEALTIDKNIENVIGKEKQKKLSSIINERLTPQQQHVYQQQLEYQQQQQLVSQFLTEYNNTKFYIDAIDLIHDVNSVLGVSGEVHPYIEALKKIGNNTDFNNLIDDLKGVSHTTIQHKINEKREKKIKHLIEEAIKINIPFPNWGPEREMSKATGYFELFKNIGIQSETLTKNKIYSESGRNFAFKDYDKFEELMKHYDENEGNFKEDCAAYCSVTEDIVNKFINTWHTEPKQSGQSDSAVTPYCNPLLPCTTFDGAGTTDVKLFGKNEYQKYKFEKVFNKYDYTVHTCFNKTTNKWNHLIIVNDNTGTIAAFAFENNCTINKLLNTVGIETTRDGEGGKGNFININDVISQVTSQDKTLGIALPKELTEPTPNTFVDKDNGNVSYARKSNTLNETDYQLILLGLKTIGDLVVYKYREGEKGRDVAFVGSTDKGIQYSNVLDCLKKRDEDITNLSTSLMGVFRSTAKGWSYREGVSVSDPESEIKNIKIKLSSYYYFCQSYEKVVNPEEKNKSTGIEGLINSSDEVHRFTNMLNFRYKMFEFFPKYNKTENNYQKIMNELLQMENEVLKTKVKELYNKSQKIFTNYANSIDTLKLCNEIQKLPDLKTAFLSNVSRFALNNETDNNIFGSESIFKDTSANIIINSSTNKVRFIYVTDSIKKIEKGGDITVECYPPSGLSSAKQAELDRINEKNENNENKKQNLIEEIENKFKDFDNLVTEKQETDKQQTKHRYTEAKYRYTEVTAPLTVDFLMQALDFVHKEKSNVKNEDLIKIDISRYLDTLFMPVSEFIENNETIEETLKNIGYKEADPPKKMVQSAGKRRNTTRKRRRRVTRRKGPIIPKKKKKKRHTRKGKR